MSPATTSPVSGIKALAFDVFGTVVDWRTAVTEELSLRAHLKLASPSIPSFVQERLEAKHSDEFWARFAQDWRDSYSAFTSSFEPGTTPWKSVDEHHRDSLIALLESHGLGRLYSEGEVESLSLVWHRLPPWQDAPEGLAELAERGYVTSTLSNGNTQLLQDLEDFGALGFRKLLSAEDFGMYKPRREVYEGAVRELGLEKPGELALVAAHLNDLDAARKCGLRTVYVERPQEEAWSKDSDEYKGARQWVDLWISRDEGEDSGRGFVDLAKRLDTP